MPRRPERRRGRPEQRQLDPVRGRVLRRDPDPAERAGHPGAPARTGHQDVAVRSIRRVDAVLEVQRRVLTSQWWQRGVRGQAVDVGPGARTALDDGSDVGELEKAVGRVAVDRRQARSADGPASRDRATVDAQTLPVREDAVVDHGVHLGAVARRDARPEADDRVVQAEPRLRSPQRAEGPLQLEPDRRVGAVARAAGPRRRRMGVRVGAALPVGEREHGRGGPGEPVRVDGRPEAVVVVVAPRRQVRRGHAVARVPAPQVVPTAVLVVGGAARREGDRHGPPVAAVHGPVHRGEQEVARGLVRRHDRGVRGQTRRHAGLEHRPGVRRGARGPLEPALRDGEQLRPGRRSRRGLPEEGDVDGGGEAVVPSELGGT